MQHNFSRRLRDIQNEADKLIHGSPSLVDINNFQKYTDEMIRYIGERSTNPEILERLQTIPRIIDLKTSTQKGVLKTLLTGAFGFLFSESKEISRALEIVPQVKATFSSIEFLNSVD